MCEQSFSRTERMTMTHIPKATPKSYAHSYHGKKIQDNYHWLRQENWTQDTGVTNPDILAYIKDENTYTKQYFDKYKDLTNAIYEELLESIDVDDETYPITKDDYAYFSKSLKGKNYNQHWRAHRPTGKKELLLDENVLAEKFNYFSLQIFSVSPDHRYIAIAYDQDGSERLVLKILDTKTMNFSPLELTHISGNGFVWLNDGSGFYYQKVDENWRANQVYYYDFSSALKNKKVDEKCVFKEDDVTNHVNIRKSADKQHMFIDVRDPKDNVVYVQNLDNKEFNLYTPLPRTTNIKYSMEAAGHDWLIMTNDKGPNRRLISISKSDKHPLNLKNAIEVAPISVRDALIDFSVYASHVVFTGKTNGLPFLKIWDRETTTHKEIPFNMESFTLDLQQTEYNDDTARIAVSNLIQPSAITLVALKTGNQEVVKQREVPNFKTDNYITKRFEAPSQDGVLVPFTLAYKKGTDLSAAPTYLYGYGSYGYAVDPNFRATFLPLMNKGYVVVIAHIRGGGDLGRAWYEAAKLKTKKKTFEDFIACAEHLIDIKHAQKGNITIAGGSAGGMLVGATLNMRPDLFKSALAMVPFVDVINTMMDATLPLTPGEYHEWGNPEDKAYFDYMSTYCPYSNVKAQNYPALYVSSGINDPRVTYWEPTKWVAKLRHLKTDHNIVLLDTEMGAGHGGPSGKFGYLMETAKQYTFILKS